MIEIVLFEPEIPPNTGNIIRICANTGANLHLIEPLGFALEDKQLLRAGLDYHEFASIRIHPDLGKCLDNFKDRNVFALSTKGSVRYDTVQYRKGDVFVFGPESRGLPAAVLNSIENRVRIPMLAHSRSLNLSNAVAVLIFEAWRQLGFEGGS